MSHQSGGGDRYRRIKQLKKRLDKTGAYWKHDGAKDPVHGTWVSNEPPYREPDRKGKVIDKPDPELINMYEYDWRGNRVFGGKRPSKRKSVK